MNRDTLFTIKAGLEEISFYVDDKTVLDGGECCVHLSDDLRVGDRIRINLVQRTDGTWHAQKATVLCHTSQR